MEMSRCGTEQLFSFPWLDILIMRLIVSVFGVYTVSERLIELQLRSPSGERGGDLAGMQHAHRAVSHAARWQVCRSRKGYLLVAGPIRIYWCTRKTIRGGPDGVRDSFGNGALPVQRSQKWRLQCPIKEGNDFSRANKNKKAYLLAFVRFSTVAVLIIAAQETPRCNKKIQPLIK